MIPPELTAQIQRMLDGELSAGELATLEAELLANAEAREVFRRLAWLHSDLEFVHLGKKGVGDAGIVPIDRIIARQRKRVAKVSLGLAAAILLIAALVFSLKSIPEVPIATFRTSPGADFIMTLGNADDEGPQIQELTAGTRLNLRTGRLEGNFRSGVRVVIEAPCELRVLAMERVAIIDGSAWFEVPPAAKGFTVETEAFTVVDLGTAFGIDAAGDHQHEVHVARGVVEVSSRVEGGQTAVLKEGEARRIDGQGKLRTIDFDAERFPTNLPPAEGLVGHWEFNSARNGLVPDSSGNGHLGLLRGEAEIVRDPERGDVLRLGGPTGGAGRVDLDAVTPIPDLLAHRGLTLALWVKREPYTAGRSPDPTLGPGDLVGALSLGVGGDHPIASIGVNNTGGLTGFIEGDGDADQVHLRSADGLVADGVWTHLAVTFDRGSDVAKYYVNGVQVGGSFDISAVGDGTLDWNGANVGTMAAPGHPNWDFLGKIDDARIYDRPLLPEEIAELAR